MTRCLFCKRSTASSRSKEHIIPESLGNTIFVLPRGVVCDRCNNYFASKVEKPFLESPGISALRGYQAVPSKRGRVPISMGVIFPTCRSVRIRRHLSGPVKASVDLDPVAFQAAQDSASGSLLLPTGWPPPEGSISSRLFAKIALEALAHRLLNTPGWLEYLTDDTQLDPIRRHAREGFPREWAFHARRIYPAERRFPSSAGSFGQMVWECDFLWTNGNGSEQYFILAIFGQEFTINMGGPDIDGYLDWLRIHNDASPLHWGKNSSKPGGQSEL